MANNGEAPQGTVKDRVLKCEVSLKAAEETIRKQGEVIAQLREENQRLAAGTSNVQRTNPKQSKRSRRENKGGSSI